MIGVQRIYRTANPKCSMIETKEKKCIELVMFDKQLIHKWYNLNFFKWYNLIRKLHKYIKKLKIFFLQLLILLF